MYKTLIAAAVLSLVFAAPAMADNSAKAATPANAKTKCKVAEVHPITGHLECVDPPGAPIEQPKERILPPCPPEKAGDAKDKKKQEWVVHTNCVKPDGKEKHGDSNSGKD